MAQKDPRRRPLIAGNWKMNLTLASARELASGIVAGLPKTDSIEIAICPPFIYLFPMAKAIMGTPIQLGAQNLYPEASGAFTGEVSPAMVKETGAAYVIVGHSERRHTIGPAKAGGGVWGEDDVFVNRKVKAALSSRLSPILCIGETLAQRDANETNAVLQQQIDGGLAGLSFDEVRRVVVAYEPVWAIGTGRNATASQAQEAHAFIRRRLGQRFDGQTAADVRILYGGSMKASNAAELIGCPDVDGGLVGGASLKADEFLGIVTAGLKAKGLG